MYVYKMFYKDERNRKINYVVVIKNLIMMYIVQDDVRSRSLKVCTFHLSISVSNIGKSLTTRKVSIKILQMFTRDFKFIKNIHGKDVKGLE